MTFTDAMRDVSADIVNALGEEAIYTRLNQAPVTIMVLFSMPYTEAGFRAEGASITAEAITSSIPLVKNGDLLSVRGVTYRIAGVQPQDDATVTELVLKL